MTRGRFGMALAASATCSLPRHGGHGTLRVDVTDEEDRAEDWPVEKFRGCVKDAVAGQRESSVEGDDGGSTELEREGRYCIGSTTGAPPDRVAADGLLELFRQWIYDRHEEVQDYTAGFVVTVDYVAPRSAAGQVPCYGDFLAAQRAAVQVMHQDSQAIAVPCDVERYKRALDEQLRWVAAILPEVLGGEVHGIAERNRRRRKLRPR